MRAERVHDHLVQLLIKKSFLDDVIADRAERGESVDYSSRERAALVFAFEQLEELFPDDAARARPIATGITSRRRARRAELMSTEGA